MISFTPLVPHFLTPLYKQYKDKILDSNIKIKVIINPSIGFCKPSFETTFDFFRPPDAVFGLNHPAVCGIIGEKEECTHEFCGTSGTGDGAAESAPGPV